MAELLPRRIADTPKHFANVTGGGCWRTEGAAWPWRERLVSMWRAMCFNLLRKSSQTVAKASGIFLFDLKFL